MRLLWLLVVGLLVPSPSFAAVAHVADMEGACSSGTASGIWANTTCGSGGTFSYTAAGSGNGVVLFVSCDATSEPTVSLAATGWSFSQIGPMVGSATAGYAGLFRAYAPNTSAATVTVTSSLSCNSFASVLIDEFSGVDPTDFAENADATYDDVAGCSLSVTPDSNDTAIWFGCKDDVSFIGGSYTKGADDTFGNWTEWRVLSGGTGVSQPSSFGSSGAGVIFGMAIKSDGLAAGSESGQRLLVGVGR